MTSILNFIFFMTIKLFIDYMSQPSRAVWAVLFLGKIPHEVIETRLMKMEQRSEEFVKINPQKKVPGMLDTENGLAMGESHAMMRYLAEKYPQHLQQWYPKDDLAKRAKIDEYLDFHHLNTRKCSFLIFNSLFAKNLGIVDPTFNAEKAKKDVEFALKTFTKLFLKDQQFIMGDKPTFADISAYYEIQFLMLLGEDFSKWEKIGQWLLRMGQIKQIREANKAFIKVITKRNPAAKL